MPHRDPDVSRVFSHERRTVDDKPIHRLRRELDFAIEAKPRMSRTFSRFSGDSFELSVCSSTEIGLNS